MPNMPTVSEAQEALETLRRFLDGLSQVFGSSMPEASVAPVFKPRLIPKTWKKRVLVILERNGAPMKPREVTARYETLGWPLSPGSNLGNIIRSTFSHLKDDQAVSVDADGRYTVID